MSSSKGTFITILFVVYGIALIGVTYQGMKSKEIAVKNSVGTEQYQDTVELYNKSISRFPSSLIAKLCGFRRALP
ncbi:MAG: hypothetical protein SP1CHLAM54_10040 [Chlamydiia bacterium]|nr:hypothetical protein [Chlamydiia bacterium]MCH9615910.1 hypothetical protein [Chlamydiia bacterium]MCH9628687.1 hypothetical protein [Chlamydiia bacterium]